MLNPFPDLLTYSLLSPFILRLIAGIIFIDLGFLTFRSEQQRWINIFKTLRIPSPVISTKVLGIIEVVGGIMYILGFYTQIAALVLTIFTLIGTYIEYKDPSVLKRNIAFYIMLFGISLSLLLSGAGAFAIDIPL